MNILQNKIKNKSAKVAIIGQGYVGLPLALTINRVGFFVWGIDKDQSKILKLKLARRNRQGKGESKISYIDDVSDEEIAIAIQSQKFKPTTSFNVLKQADIIIIAVPTPLDEYKIPDLTYIKDATREIANYLHPNQLIILESTTYPGTTEEIVLPMLLKCQMSNACPTSRRVKFQINSKFQIPNSKQIQNSKFKIAIGENLFLAFSPERVDPGNKKFNTKNTPKIVGGINSESTKIAVLFYSQVIDQVVPVSSARTAEMTKLLENIFRIVNISMINELALLANKMNIDIWEVIEAASTKPYGFMPFYPGPGIGGHCIAVDPFYLSYKAREYGFFTRFIDLAGEINELMPHYVITTVATALNYGQAKSIKNAKILIMGISYKKDIKDTRESAAYKIAEILQQKGARLSFFDPYINNFQFSIFNFQLNSKFQIPKIKKLTKQIIQSFDLILITTDHSPEKIGIEYETIAKWAKVVVDTRNAIKARGLKNVYRL